MARLKDRILNKKSSSVNITPFENKPNLKKLYLYSVIVNAGQGENIERIMQNLGSSVQFTLTGEGTAPNALANVLGVTENKKEVVLAIVKEQLLDTVVDELNSYYLTSKKHRGIGFSIPLTSVIGVRLYKFLSQTM